MSLNSTPSSERTHIAFFGLRNAGKSALVNAIASQNLSIVSEIPGTTTDPVQKAMEILPLGPVLLIDTPGLDDDGELGKLRVEKARDTLSHTDIAVIVRAVDSTLNEFQEKLINDLVLELKAKDIPHINVRTKSDLLETNALSDTFNDEKNDNLNILVSAKLGTNITQLKNTLATILQEHEKQKPLVRDLIPNNGFVVLVIPIDSAAPKGRIILPQQQVLRDLLEAHALTMVVDLAELQQVFQIKKPDLVITDSQIFAEVDKITPSNVHLTSFSILMARYKGYFKEALQGLNAVQNLHSQSKILMAEGCTHHRQCDDIGTVKIPRWLRQTTNLDLNFATSSGREFPKDLSQYDLVVFCGGCMLNSREMQSRVQTALDAGVPITNYGLLIAKMRGILERSTEIFNLTL